MNKRERNRIKNKINLKLFVWGCAALGWWGIIYPEFTLTPDTCRIVDESGSCVKMDEGYDGIELYGDILQAGRDYIRPKSKLLSAIVDFYGGQGSQEEGIQREE